MCIRDSLITVHQNNSELPHNIIEPSDYGDYVKKPRIVLNERKRRRKRGTVLKPDSHSEGCASSNVQSNGYLGASLMSNENEGARIRTPLVHYQGNTSQIGSNNFEFTKKNADHPILQDGLNSGEGFHAGHYKETNGQQVHVNDAVHPDDMNKRIALNSHSLLLGTKQRSYDNFFPSPYEHLPRPPLPVNLVSHIPPIQSQFVQIIPANTNPMAGSFNGISGTMKFEKRQNIHPQVSISNVSDEGAPTQTTVYHLNEVNRNRPKLTERPSLKLNISRATNDICQQSPVVYSRTASPNLNVQHTSDRLLSSAMSSPFACSNIVRYNNNDTNGSNHSGPYGSTYINGETSFLKPPIGRPPKLPKSTSSSIVVFPSSVTRPDRKSTSPTESSI